MTGKYRPGSVTILSNTVGFRQKHVAQAALYHIYTYKGVAYVHAEFAAVLSSVFFEPGDELRPGHLLQSLDLNTER